MWEQAGILHNLTVQDVEEFGGKVALIWTRSKGPELQKVPEGLGNEAVLC